MSASGEHNTASPKQTPGRACSPLAHFHQEVALLPKWIVYGEATVRVYVDATVEAETESEAEELAEDLFYDVAREEIMLGNFDIDYVNVVSTEPLDDEEEEG